MSAYVQPLPLRAAGGAALAAALAAGAVVGCVVAGDGLLAHARLVARVFGASAGDYPYAAAGAVFALVMLVATAPAWTGALWRRRTAFAVALVMLTSHLTALAAGPLNPLVGAIALAVGIWLVDLLAGRGLLPHSAFRTLCVLFFACALMSTIGAYPTDVLGGLIALAPKIVLAIVLAELLDRPEHVRFAVSAMLWAAALLAGVGLAQSAAYLLLGADYSLAEPSYRYASTPFGAMLRATGFSRTANQYAPPIGAACVMAAVLALATPGKRWRYAALFAITLAAVALSIVRGMWVATFAGLLAVPFLVKPRLTPVWLAAGLVIAVIALASGLASWTVQSITGLSEGGVAERAALAGAAMEAMASSPSGTGINNFAEASPTFERYPVHNAVLQVGAELGVPGLAVFVALLAWTAWRLAGAWRNARSPEVRSRLAALLAGFVTLAIGIQGEPMGYSQFLWIYLALSDAAARTAART